MSSFNDFQKKYGISKITFISESTISPICKIDFVNNNILNINLPNFDIINTKEKLYKYIEQPLIEYYKKIRKQKLDEIQK
jgi:hypothetical protein